MQWLPNYALGWRNGWLPVGLYLAGLIALSLTFPAPMRKRLFFKPGPANPVRRIALVLTRLGTFAYHGLALVSPLRAGGPRFAIGLALYLAGCSLVARSLLVFRYAPLDRPIEVGMYRWSRNPQWLGLVGVFTGTALMVGTWVQLIALSVLVLGYHAQILNEEDACRQQYGEAYRAYMTRVPRYLLGL